MKTNNAIETRVKCYGDNEMITKANKLKDAGYTRVANAYWVEHWQKDNALLILERCDESERPTTTEPTNTPATMNANETISAAIIAELNTRKDRSAWNKGVTEYATELAESLDNWDKQSESVAELREMMLNGADDWKAYSWGGSSLIYNQDIAERLCSPSELKRVTNKNGLRDYPNSREHWLDVQARAMYQAANRVAEIAAKYLSK